MSLISVMDVGHGSCVSLLADDGKRWLFDCGHDDYMRPSAILSGPTIHRLTISNFDQDHISDLPELRQKFGIEVLTCNPGITPSQLALLKLKSGPISEAMRHLLTMMGIGGAGGFAPIPSSAVTAANVTVTHFANRYGSHNPNLGTFADTNNISLVTFLHTHGLHMVLPGDLERPGWLALLRDPHFRAELARVNVFLASHHGRESGYCEEVFSFCRPELVVMSDSAKEHATQEMAGVYAQKASGCVINGRLRKVLTTRCDGSIWFNASLSRTTVEISTPAPGPSLWEAAFAPTPPPVSSLSLWEALLAPPPSAAPPASVWQAFALDPPKGWR